MYSIMKTYKTTSITNQKIQTMKKALPFILLAHFLLIANSNAQKWQWGIRAALGQSSVKTIKTVTQSDLDYTFYTEPKLGYECSLITQRELFPRFGFDFAVGYTLKGGILKYVVGQKRGDLRYIQLVPELWYQPIKHPDIKLFGGVQRSFLVYSNIVSSNPVSNRGFAWTAGIELRTESVGFYGKYVLSTTPFAHEDFRAVGFPEYHYYNRELLVGASFYLY